MSGTGLGNELGAQAAQSRALAVLRVRQGAVAFALLPTAVAVVLLAGGATGHITGGSWEAAQWAVTLIAVAVVLFAAVVAAVIVRARPALSPTVAVTEDAAPDLYRMVRDLAEKLEVPAPSAIALTPDCDSWLEDRTHPAHARLLPGGLGRNTAAAPVLVIGSPFLWWMRVAELRAVLAPVVAGTGPSAQPDIAAARRFVRGLDAAIAVTSRADRGPTGRAVLGTIGGVVRMLLRRCGEHAALMERGVAVASSERAQAVDYGLRIVAQEQVGLAYAGWDRLLTRVALPAWRMGRWPSRLDVGVVSALTELSRRDRLAEGFASRLGERPACDLLEEPGTIDEATSLLAARLFHGGPDEPGPDWAPVNWQQYPEEVVDRKWRTEAARLQRVLDELGVRRSAGSAGPTLARVVDHLAGGDGTSGGALAAGLSAELAREELAREELAREELAREEPSSRGRQQTSRPPQPATSPAPESHDHGALVVSSTAQHPRQPTTSAKGHHDRTPAEAARDALALWGTDPLPLLPLQPPRTERELLADHVTAMVCCAAMDTAGAVPGLDWLDGPALLFDGARRTDLGVQVLSLVEDGDAAPLRSWLAAVGVRAEKPVRLV